MKNFLSVDNNINLDEKFEELAKVENDKKIFSLEKYYKILKSSILYLLSNLLENKIEKSAEFFITISNTDLYAKIDKESIIVKLIKDSECPECFVKWIKIENNYVEINDLKECYVFFDIPDFACHDLTQKVIKILHESINRNELYSLYYLDLRNMAKELKKKFPNNIDIEKSEKIFDENLFRLCYYYINFGFYFDFDFDRSALNNVGIENFERGEIENRTLCLKLCSISEEEFIEKERKLNAEFQNLKTQYNIEATIQLIDNMVYLCIPDEYISYDESIENAVRKVVKYIKDNYKPSRIIENADEYFIYRDDFIKEIDAVLRENVKIDNNIVEFYNQVKRFFV